MHLTLVYFALWKWNSHRIITDIAHALFNYYNLFTLEFSTLSATAQGLHSIWTIEFNNRSNFFFPGSFLTENKKD